MQQNFVSLHEKNINGIIYFIEKTKRLPSTIVIPQAHMMLDCVYNNEISEEEFQEFLHLIKNYFSYMEVLTLQYLKEIEKSNEIRVNTIHIKENIAGYRAQFDKNMTDINDKRHWLRYSAALTSVKVLDDVAHLAASVAGTVDNITKEYYGNKYKKVIGGFDSIAKSVETGK